MKGQEEQKYEDILLLSRPESKKHPRMPLADRAAQFAPFAALTGYDAALKETLEQAVKRVEQEMEGVSFDEI